MTATQIAPPVLPALAPTPIAELRFGTLLGVELRKMTDTRASRWTLTSILTIALFTLGWKFAKADTPVTLREYAEGVVPAIAFLVPVVGLLAMSSEWSQRTALTTFTLAPRRLPVFAAKYVAALIVSLAVMATGLVVSAGVTVLAGVVHDTGASFAGAGEFLRSALIVVGLQMTMAAAFGALAGQTPLALVGFYIAPTVWGSAGTAIFGDSAEWFDVFAAYGRLTSNEPFESLAQTVVSVAIWVVVPAVVGIARALRRDAK
jgi:ABC-type transport system involved in multi-copper enzyme maturation permease subunit